MNVTGWQIFFMSALPVTELRVTIPLALAVGFAPVKAFVLAVLGNLLPVVPLMLLLEPLSRKLRRFPALDSLFQKILIRTRRKGSQVQNYGIIGLLLFVAVPLPGTGAWTGAILAWLLGFDLYLSVISICAGVMLAGALVTLAGMGMVRIALMTDLEYVLIIAAVAILLMVWYKNKH
ncbi:MAG: small multi-drug export protein [Peptococcaceae bacterium]|jgi:uncharacterized membrane protein|nr:small multi-drug export protein [Peptococcaceae bacterium]MDH7525570.1 small multi-drug export protein [Peptococcaceae bacterium]